MILVKGILLLPISMFIRIMSSMKMILDWLLLQQMRVSTPYLMVMCCSLFHLRLPMKLALDLFTWVSRINSISIASASVYQYPQRQDLSPYLAHLVSSTKFRKFVYPLAQGSTRFNLQKNDFMKKKFILPTIEKQRRIATTLDAINAQLANEKRLKDLYIAKKEYLLRQIFI